MVFRFPRAWLFLNKKLEFLLVCKYSDDYFLAHFHTIVFGYFLPPFDLVKEFAHNLIMQILKMGRFKKRWMRFWLQVKVTNRLIAFLFKINLTFKNSDFWRQKRIVWNVKIEIFSSVICSLYRISNSH